MPNDLTPKQLAEGKRLLAAFDNALAKLAKGKNESGRLQVDGARCRFEQWVVVFGRDLLAAGLRDLHYQKEQKSRWETFGKDLEREQAGTIGRDR